MSWNPKNLQTFFRYAKLHFEFQVRVWNVQKDVLNSLNKLLTVAANEETSEEIYFI